jgi:NTP pyrophosphatase (non-canonical NTP hydrolase)
MGFKRLRERALEIRRQYARQERVRCGRSWTGQELALGFVGDVGDLVKLVQAASGVRDIPNARARLAHELADCLWSVLVLADAYGVDVERAFLDTMDELEQRLSAHSLGAS